MNRKVAKLSILSVSFLAAFIIAGCFLINTVTQPSSVTVSTAFSTNVAVTVEGQSDANPHYAIVGLLIPNDFIVDSVIFSDGYTGVCSYLPPNVSDNEPGGQVDYWTDSLEGRFPSGSTMKWVVYQSTTSYVTVASNLPVNLLVKMKSGTTIGTYNIGYFVSDAALDFTDASYYAKSLNNSLTVTGATPVELTSFRAAGTLKGIELSWSTATEVNNQRFEIERSNGNNTYSVIGTVNGNGTRSSKTEYSFIDKSVNAGKYTYRLKQYDFNGAFEYSKSVEVNYVSANDFNLVQNYPNPFNPSTKISFSLPVESDVVLSVYNTAGELIKTLASGRMQAGSHSFNFDASGLSSGIYLYTLSSKGINGKEFSQTAKMLLLK